MHALGETWFSANKWRPFLWFTAIFLISCLFLGYHRYFNLPPCSVHQWKQAEAAAYAMNYYENGLHFFRPQLYNLSSAEGRCISEFPLVNYLAALGYTLFGPASSIYRLITLLFVFGGFYCLFRMIRQLLANTFLATAFFFIFFSSSILAYYALNFLTDPASLGLCLASYCFLLRYFKEGKRKQLAAAFTLMTLASLLSLPYLLHLAAFVIVFFNEWVWGIRLTDKGRLIIHPGTFLALILISVMVIYLWKLWADSYNARYGSMYSISGTGPIWMMQKQDIAHTWNLVTAYWYNKYYYESFFHFFLLLNLVGVFLWKGSGRAMVFFTIVVMTMGLLYFVLYFRHFADLDFAMFPLLPGIIFPVILSYQSLMLKRPKVFNSLFAALILAILGLLGLNYARLNLERRYDLSRQQAGAVPAWDNSGPEQMTLYGIKGSELVVSYPDPSPNISLYFLGYKGWTIDTGAPRKSDTLAWFIRNGASLLVIRDSAALKSAGFERFMHYPIGSAHGILIFKLFPFMDPQHYLFLRPRPETWQRKFK